MSSGDDMCGLDYGLELELPELDECLYGEGVLDSFEDLLLEEEDLELPPMSSAGERGRKRSRGLRDGEMIYTVEFQGQVYDGYTRGPPDKSVGKWAFGKVGLEWKRGRYNNQKPKRRLDRPPPSLSAVLIDADGIRTGGTTKRVVTNDVEKTPYRLKPEFRMTDTATSSSSSSSQPRMAGMAHGGEVQALSVHKATFSKDGLIEALIVWFISVDGKPHRLPTPFTHLTPERDDLSTLAEVVRDLGRAMCEIVGANMFCVSSLDKVEAMIERRRSEEASTVIYPSVVSPVAVAGRDYAYEHDIHPDDVMFAEEMRVPGTIVQQVGDSDGVFIRRALYGARFLRLRVVPLQPHTVHKLATPPANPIVCAVLGHVLVRADVFPGDEVEDGGHVVINAYCTPGVGLYVPLGTDPDPYGAVVGQVLCSAKQVDPSGQANRFLLTCTVNTSGDRIEDQIAGDIDAHRMALSESANVPQLSVPVPNDVVHDLIEIAHYLLDHPGLRVCICGPSGSGTSTAAAALLSLATDMDAFPSVYRDGVCWPHGPKTWRNGRDDVLPALPLIDHGRLFPSRSFLVVLDDILDLAALENRDHYRQTLSSGPSYPLEAALSFHLPKSSSSVVAVVTTTVKSDLPPMVRPFDIVYDLMDRHSQPMVESPLGTVSVKGGDSADLGCADSTTGPPGGFMGKASWSIRWPLLTLDPFLSSLPESLPHPPHAHLFAAMLATSVADPGDVAVALVAFAAQALGGRQKDGRWSVPLDLLGSFVHMSPLNQDSPESSVYLSCLTDRISLEDLNVLAQVKFLQIVESQGDITTTVVIKVGGLAWDLLGAVLALFVTLAREAGVDLGANPWRRVWYPVVGVDESLVLYVSSLDRWSTSPIDDDLPCSYRILVTDAWSAFLTKAVTRFGWWWPHHWRRGCSHSSTFMNSPASPLWLWSSGMIPLSYPLSLGPDSIAPDALVGVFLFRAAVVGLDGWVLEADAAALELGADNLDEFNLNMFQKLRRAILGQLGTCALTQSSRPVVESLTTLAADGADMSFNFQLLVTNYDFFNQVWCSLLRLNVACDRRCSTLGDETNLPEIPVDLATSAVFGDDKNELSKAERIRGSLVPFDALHDGAGWYMVVPDDVRVIGWSRGRGGVLVIWGRIAEGGGSSLSGGRMKRPHLHPPVVAVVEMGWWDVGPCVREIELDFDSPVSTYLIDDILPAKEACVMVEGGRVCVQSTNRSGVRGEVVWSYTGSAGEWVSFPVEEWVVFDWDVGSTAAGSSPPGRFVKAGDTWLYTLDPRSVYSPDWKVVWISEDVDDGCVAVMVGKDTGGSDEVYPGVCIGLSRLNKTSSSTTTVGYCVDDPQQHSVIRAPDCGSIRGVGIGTGRAGSDRECGVVACAWLHLDGAVMVVVSRVDIVGDSVPATEGDNRVELCVSTLSASPRMGPDFEHQSKERYVGVGRGVVVDVEEGESGDDVIVRAYIQCLESQVLVVEGQGSIHGGECLGWQWRAWVQTNPGVQSSMLGRGRGPRTKMRCVAGMRWEPQDAKLVWTETANELN